MYSLLFGVRVEKEKALRTKMEELGIREEDLKESFLLPGTRGGQKANKGSSKVRIEHIPSGIQVSCQKSRSQALNRFLARRILVEKIEEKLEKSHPTIFRKKNRAKQKEIEKKKKAKNRRRKNMRKKTEQSRGNETDSKTNIDQEKKNTV